MKWLRNMVQYCDSILIKAPQISTLTFEVKDVDDAPIQISQELMEALLYASSATPSLLCGYQPSRGNKRKGKGETAGRQGDQKSLWIPNGPSWPRSN